MSNVIIFLITLVTLVIVVWGWMKLAYLGRSSAPQGTQEMSPGEKTVQLVLELVLFALVVLLFMWWKQP